MSKRKRQASKHENDYSIVQPRKPINAGKKRLPEPTSIKHVFVMIIMHVCRRIVLFEPELKIAIYLAALLCGSLVCDFIPVPRGYFSRKNNLFNYYFVKYGWGWTFISVGTFLGLTSYVYCCGNMERIRKHFYRLLIATGMWFCWTKLFVLIESYTVGCLDDKYITRLTCVNNGSIWRGFDISGHAFLLIYCNLFITEEAKSIRGWERIGEFIRNDDYVDDSPLKGLSPSEMEHLKEYYEKLTPYVRTAFLNLTLFSVLWDSMLITTILYFHSMVQKVVGGCIAILMWYVTYRYWFQMPSSPGLPGQGCFKYKDQPMKRTGTR